MGFHINTEQLDAWLAEQQKHAGYYNKRIRGRIKLVLPGCRYC